MSQGLVIEPHIDTKWQTCKVNVHYNKLNEILNYRCLNLIISATGERYRPDVQSSRFAENANKYFKVPAEIENGSRARCVGVFWARGVGENLLRSSLPRISSIWSLIGSGIMLDDVR